MQTGDFNPWVCLSITVFDVRNCIDVLESKNQMKIVDIHDVYPHLSQYDDASFGLGLLCLHIYRSLSKTHSRI